MLFVHFDQINYSAYNSFMEQKLLAGAEREQMIEQVVGLQKSFVHQLQANIAPLWSRLDLTMSQLKALQVIAHSGPLPVGGLAQALDIGKPAASLLVNVLVRRNLVTRTEDPADRRRTLVELSAHGRELVEQLQGSHQRLVNWLRRLSDQDLAGLSQALQALLAIASADLSPCDHGKLPPTEEPGPVTAR